MGRRKKDYKAVYMKVDAQLFHQSKTIIEDRTADYEDYLRRRIRAADRPELIRLEIEEHENKIKQLEKEHDIEINLKGEMEEIEVEFNSVLEGCLDTVIRIVDNQGSIGLDKLENIADLHNISVAELKEVIPKYYKDKIVKYHFKTKGEDKLTGLELGGS